MMNIWSKKWLRTVGVILFTIHCSLFTVSCSEDETEEGEFYNWKQKNEAVIEQWAANTSYQKILTYSKDVTTPNITNSDYIYVEVLESGVGGETPLFTDSVFYSYRGRLIPSKTYENGYVFDQSFLGDFDWTTSGMLKACVSWNPVMTTSGIVETLFTQGFCTALQHMKKGDRWLVHIPYQLGYGESGNRDGSVPGYSNLVFELAVSDIWHPGESRPSFK